MALFGILAALGALVGWGVGDFLIQRLTRRIGNFRTMLYGGSFGFLVLTPFAWSHLPDAFGAWQDTVLLIGISSVVFFNAFFNFEALRKGKIAVIAPVLALELPLTALLAVALIGERLTPGQVVAILAVVVGFFFVVRQKSADGSWRKPSFERGVAYAIIGVFGLAFYNFTIGISSRATEPVLTAWVIGGTVAILSFITLLVRREVSAKSLIQPLRKYPGLILAESVCVVGAGLCFAYATTLIPISVATGVSEGYVVLSVMLGLLINREKLRRSQLFGVGIVVLGILGLAWMTA
jgi:drug/metabolite transporter (DMT)-like permease